MSGEIRGRYAPSPTGELHLGNASSALLAWGSVRARGGTFVLRMEDLDRNRSRPELAQRILDDLTWLGIDWDEGPDRGGPRGPYVQQQRGEVYRNAFERLREQGRLYPCFCSRKDIATAASAPQAPGEEARYTRTCLGLEPALAAARVARGERHAWRFRTLDLPAPRFDDRVRGPVLPELPDVGDFVVMRSDGVPAYQLAVVVDDAAMAITEVVRGDDLLGSTVRQLLLHDALGYTPPVFGHVPLLLGPDGVRLSKRHAGITLRELREAGFAAEQIVGRLAMMLGLRTGSDPLAAADLAANLRLDRLPRADGGIVVDPRLW